MVATKRRPSFTLRVGRRFARRVELAGAEREEDDRCSIVPAVLVRRPLVAGTGRTVCWRVCDLSVRFAGGNVAGCVVSSSAGSSSRNGMGSGAVG